jgi:hypothetical protein
LEALKDKKTTAKLQKESKNPAIVQKSFEKNLKNRFKYSKTSKA